MRKKRFWKLGASVLTAAVLAVSAPASAFAATGGYPAAVPRAETAADGEEQAADVEKEAAAETADESVGTPAAPAAPAVQEEETGNTVNDPAEETGTREADADTVEEDGGKEKEEAEAKDTANEESVPDIEYGPDIEEEYGREEDEPERPFRFFAAGRPSANPAASLKSYGLPVINIQLNGVSLDTVNSGDKSIKYKGNTVSLYDGTSGESVVQSNVELKGHGNSTWGKPQKPYQIKFEKKTSLLGMPKAKKYLLIANYIDPALVRNKAAQDIAAAIGLGHADYRFVNLYVDGQYVGNYMLSQKVEISSVMVDLNAEDGIIAEVDIHPSADDYTFRSGVTNALMSLKDSVSEDEAVYKAACAAFLKDYEQFERDAKAGNWEAVQQEIDVDSFVKYYIVSEVSENPDAQRTSFYIYRDGAGDVLHTGPAWDYDYAFGNYIGSQYNHVNLPGIYLDPRVQDENGSHVLSYLMDIPEFRDRVEDFWASEGRQAVLNEIDELQHFKSTLRSSFVANASRWGKTQDIDGAVGSLTSWMSARVSYLDKFFAKAADIEDGVYTIRNGSYYLDTVNKAMYVGSYRFDGSQHFRITDAGGGYVTIVQETSGKALTTDAAAYSEGCGTGIHSNTGRAQQLWRIIRNSDGTYSFISKSSGLMLGLAGNATEAQSVRATGYEKGSAHQRFAIQDPPSDTVAEIEDGTYYLNAYRSVRIGVNGQSGAGNANIEAQSPSYLHSQVFRIASVGDGYYSITNLYSGKALAIADTSRGNGVNVVQQTYNGAATQQWKFVEAGEGCYFIANRQSGLVIDVCGGTLQNGTNIWTYYGNRSQAQKFKLGRYTQVEFTQGKYYTITSALNGNMVLDIANGSTANGANLQLWKSNKSGAQKFRMVLGSDGYYTIVNYNSNRAIDVYNGNTANCTNVWQYKQNGTKAQKWAAVKNSDGTYTFYNANSGKVLDVANGTPNQGNNVWQYTANGTKAQKWKVA